MRVSDGTSWAGLIRQLLLCVRAALPAADSGSVQRAGQSAAAGRSATGGP